MSDNPVFHQTRGFEKRNIKILGKFRSFCLRPVNITIKTNSQLNKEIDKLNSCKC